jgi:hypothetical protein
MKHAAAGAASAAARAAGEEKPGAGPGFSMSSVLVCLPRSAQNLKFRPAVTAEPVAPPLTAGVRLPMSSSPRST